MSDPDLTLPIPTARIHTTTIFRSFIETEIVSERGKNRFCSAQIARFSRFQALCISARAIMGQRERERERERERDRERQRVVRECP